jgi:hypothetical protein
MSDSSGTPRVTRALRSSFTSWLFLISLICPGAAEAQVVSYAFVPNWSGPTKVTVIDTTTHTVVPSTISTASSAV